VKNKIYSSFDDAVVDIPNGATIMFAGFGGVGAPQNLIAALHRQGAYDLTGISNEAGGVDGRVDVGTLVEAGQIRKMICCFTAATHPSRQTPFFQMYNKGEIEAELVPQGTLAESIRSAGAGIGAFYTPTSVGTELAQHKEHRDLNGRMHVLEYALHADFAFIRAWNADTFGNLQFRLAQRNFNPIMATATRITIVEVENEIVPVGDLDPDQIHTPGVYVNRIVRIPPDGIWA
jgi:3-oxoadipate CoA-transferase alpha subunit